MSILRDLIHAVASARDFYKVADVAVRGEFTKPTKEATAEPIREA